MERVKYVKPEFNFQEMRLSERVAATCWGYAYAWYDADEDGIIDEDGEKVNLSQLGLGEHGCQGAAARNALKKYFMTKYPNAPITDSDVSTNVKEGGLIDPIGSN